jgi:hypothetical protein
MSRDRRDGYVGLRRYVTAQPKNTFSKRLYGEYWRMVFLTGRVVHFKSLYAGNRLTGVVVFTTRARTMPCLQHQLYKKGFPVKDKRCDVDTCVTCTDGRSIARMKGVLV